MNAIVVGDLHGEISFYQQVRSMFDEKIILVGDLLDSLIFTRTEQYRLLELVLNDIEAGQTECIFGNHELGYLMKRMLCTGHSSSFESRIIPFKSRMWKLMKPFIFDMENKVLITHAGLNSQLLHEAFSLVPPAEHDMELIDLFLTESWREPDDGIIYNIGHSRGGSERNAGIFWSDYYADFNPVEGLSQVFGHTPGSDIRKRGNNWCIDCLLGARKVVQITGDVLEEVIIN